MPVPLARKPSSMGDATGKEHFTHWADIAADRTLRAHPDANTITVAAGITPSGVVHIGNFREVMTVDLVARALRDRGVNTRFIYSWDDFDVFRKVPKDAPHPEMLAEHIGRSIVDVPDPYGDADSYASHHIQNFERSLAPLGIAPEFIRQHAMYRKGAYAEGIRRALEQAAVIRAIINGSRERHGALSVLGDDWLPLTGFCSACGKDDLAFTWDGEWVVHVSCNTCKHPGDVDLRKGGNLKLPWRIDWPMRWAHERVCFEPGGKDHSSAGGSYDTAKDIVKQVYGFVAPEYVGYDFVSIKGRGGKISSSKGDVVTVADCLEIYEPQLLRWIFANYRPNTEFQISFDLDVIKLYEDYDRAVRLAHESESGREAAALKKQQMARRTLELASVEPRAIVPGTPPPFQPGFRHLSVLLQIFDGDIEHARREYVNSGELTTDAEHASFGVRARCVWNWIERYAPDEFRYRIRDTPEPRKLAPEHSAALASITAWLQSEPHATDAMVGAHFKALAGGGQLDMKAFYPVVYDLLIARDHGPKLSTLIAAMGPERAVPLLRAGVFTDINR